MIPPKVAVKQALCTLLMAVSFLCGPGFAKDVERTRILDAMKRATVFMTDKVSYKGGYVWNYLPDLSRRWGEMEATESMIWIQPPGTTMMGQLFLDAYHVTGDEYYYQAAEKTAEALILAQHPSGGWNYVADLDSEDSLRKWYNTFGKNGWRLEEFQHYYGNATFDDQATTEPAKFMLRLYMEKKDPKFKASLDKAIRFVLESQYPMGGWPQRYPPTDKFSKGGRPDYSSFITFNDGVLIENINFLIICYQNLGDSSLLEPILRSMNSILVTQQPSPQAGWGAQHSLDLKPAGARSYEPEALVTATTAGNIRHCLQFYRWTGDPKFLKRIPEALDWLDSVKLPASMGLRPNTYPRFVTIGTNKPLFIHRTGSNVISGRYYTDDNPEHTVRHYSSFFPLDVDGLRKQYESTRAIPKDELVKDSPLRADSKTHILPRFYCRLTGPSEEMLKRMMAMMKNRNDSVSDSNDYWPSRFEVTEEEPPVPTESRVKDLIDDLNSEGYWPSRIRMTSNPYKGDGPKEPAPGDFSRSLVGDEYDTSPYPSHKPVIGISVSAYTRNMCVLIHYLESMK